MKIPDSKYDSLLTFIESGAKGDLTEEMIEYLNILLLIRSMYLRFDDFETIVRFLQKPPYNLSYYLSVRYFNDSFKFFNSDREISKQAFRNAYADKLDRAADLVIKTATTSKDIDIYKNIILSAANIRQLNLPDVPEIPKEMYDRPVKIYTFKPEHVGRLPANKHLLAKQIDKLEFVSEAEKEKIKSEAGIIPHELYLDDEP